MRCTITWIEVFKFYEINFSHEYIKYLKKINIRNMYYATTRYLKMSFLNFNKNKNLSRKKHNSKIISRSFVRKEMCAFAWHWITSTKDTSTAITHATWRLKVTTVLHRITYANWMYSFSQRIYAMRLCYMLCHTVRDQSLNKRDSKSLQFTFIWLFTSIFNKL